MAENIIFDLNGVLIKFSIIDFIKEFFKYKKKFLLLWDFANPKISYDAIRFAIREPVVENGVFKLIKKYPKLSTHRAFMLDAINCQNIKPGAIKLLKDLKNSGYQLYILSNIGQQSKDILIKKYPEFFEYFNRIYCTVADNDYLCKPDKRFFIDNLKDLINSESIFIDDNIKNLETARQLCLKTIKFQSIHELQKLF